MAAPSLPSLQRLVTSGSSGIGPPHAVYTVEIFLAVSPVVDAAISAAVASVVAVSFPFTGGATPAATARRVTGEVACRKSDRAVARSPLEHDIGERDPRVHHPLPCTRVLGSGFFALVPTPPLVHGARSRSEPDQAVSVAIRVGRAPGVAGEGGAKQNDAVSASIRNQPTPVV